MPANFRNGKLRYCGFTALGLAVLLPLAHGASSGPPASSFLALDDNGTRVPPDTQGAIGPNHLMVTLNSQVRIQDRSGMTLITTNLYNWWASLGNLGATDPRVLYDLSAARWIFTAITTNSLANSILLAVS